MCTVTIHRNAESLLVTMNRDEARFRAPEIPPHVVNEKDAPHWMAPIDGQAGGTWFGANELGLQACLLNRYMPEDTLKLGGPVKPPSRGRIIVELMKKGRENAARKWLDEVFSPEPYPSFCLLLIGPKHTYSYAWNGHELECHEHTDPWLEFSSSSWRTAEVLEYRQRAFEDWVFRGAPFAGSIPSFHIWQPADRAEWAPLMDRDFSATRSITQTETNYLQGQTEMRYWPRESLSSPDSPLIKLILPLAQDAAS